MITINLLPQEMRKRERTPLILLLPLLGGLICVLSAGSLAAYVHFVWLAEVTNDRVSQEQELAQKGPRLTYETRLLAEESEFKKRVSTIEQIAAGRILMTQKIDELTELTVAGDDDDAEGYLVWVQEMKFTPPGAIRGRHAKGKTLKSGGQIKMNGFVLANEKPLQAYNRMHAALKNSNMFAVGYNDLSDPMGSLEVFQDDIEPRKGWTMDMVLELKDPAESKTLRQKIERELAEKDDKDPKNNRRGK
ncbi:MAG: nitrate reductase NapE component [Planctomycetota bacterium]|jgi:nitrate reductase NapE component